MPCQNSIGLINDEWLSKAKPLDSTDESSYLMFRMVARIFVIWRNGRDG